MCSEHCDGKTKDGKCGFRQCHRRPSFNERSAAGGKMLEFRQDRDAVKLTANAAFFFDSWAEAAHPTAGTGRRKQKTIMGPAHR